MAPPKTIRFVLGATSKLFEERGIPSARLDAEVLLAHVLGTSRIQLYTDHDRPLAEAELEPYRALVRRRLQREPVAYLTGLREFHGITFAVDARVLVPRPETEHLVEEALARAGDRSGLRVADVATGSGAVAISLGKALGERARVWASDRSAGALDVARANAARAGVEVTFLEGDLGAPIRPHAPFDVVTANLPYLTAAEMESRAPELRFEPELALAGGADGLDLVRRLVAEAPGLLAPAGALCLEIGAGQGEATLALFDATWVDVQLVRDLAGLPRVVAASRRADTNAAPA